MGLSHSTFLGLEPDPVNYLAALDRGRATGRVAFLLSEDEHTLSYGHLDQNARTGEMRDAYLYDYSVMCSECRPHRLSKETVRFVAAFEDWDMWITVLAGETKRRSIQEWCKRRGIYYGIVPIWTQQLVTVTTGPVDDTSALVDDHNDIYQLVIEQYWPGREPDGSRRSGISRSKGGFFPPEREYDFYETYHKEGGIRCWHLHSTKETAEACRETMRQAYPDLPTGWYIRGTTPWHRVGRLAVTGSALEALAEQCGIACEPYEAQNVASLLLEPMSWDDPKLQRFLVEAGWKPPSSSFRVPPLTLELRVAVRHGRLTGQAVGGHGTKA
jgi:hypothetical protein